MRPRHGTATIPALALGETMDDLVITDGLHYKKFTDVPFNGKVTGQYQGRIKDGKKDGPWVTYFGNGRIEVKGTYKDREQIAKGQELAAEYWESTSCRSRRTDRWVAIAVKIR
jgi:hypothetical protein